MHVPYADTHVQVSSKCITDWLSSTNIPYIQGVFVVTNIPVAIYLLRLDFTNPTSAVQITLHILQCDVALPYR